MPAAQYYDVFDKGKQIMTRATAKQVRAGLDTNINITQYAYCGSVYRGRYTFRFSDDQIEVAELSERYNRVKSAFTREMFNEWVTMNQRYGTIGDKA